MAALACRNNGSRLYGKPLQNLHTEQPVTILEQIVASLKSIREIDDIVLGISQFRNLFLQNLHKSSKFEVSLVMNTTCYQD